MEQQSFRDELLQKLDVASEVQMGGMISGLPPARPSTISRVPSSASVGQLNLPPELLLHALQFLDFQSLSRFSRASLAAKVAVESLTAYKAMMAHAPEVLTALSRTRLIARHPAQLLHQTLHSSRCVSCAFFGGFLFLPACERACLECLYENSDLRVIAPSVAKERFCLSLTEVNSLPRMRGVPGVYGPVAERSRQGACKLVSVRDARRLAVEVHGSEEAVEVQGAEEAVDRLGSPWGRPVSVNWRLSGPYQRLVRSLLGLRDNIMSVQPSAAWAGDAYLGMASARFPSVAGDGVEHGRLCRGCWFMLRDGSLHGTSDDKIKAEREGSRLRSEEGFVEHVRACEGVRLLLERGEVAG